METYMIGVIKQKIGKKLNQLRKDKEISTYQMEKAGLRTEIRLSIENGSANYTIDSLLRYMEICGITFDDLV